jgi:excisionase family DNA binding protein
MHQSQSTAPRYVSIASAAEYASVSQKTVRRWIAEGRIQGFRLGRRIVRVDLTEVDACFRPIPTVRQAG